MKKILKISGKPSLQDILIWVFCAFILLFMFLAVGIHPASLYCSAFIFMALIFVIFSGFSSIKSIEIDKDEIIFHTKNEIISVKLNEIEEFKVIAKGAGLEIKIKTTQADYMVPLNYLASRISYAFLIENAASINNFSIEGKNLWTSNMNFHKNWQGNALFQDNKFLINCATVSFLIFCGFYMGNTILSEEVYYTVATTDDLQTASDIQKLITTPTLPTKMRIDGNKISLSVQTKDYKKAIAAEAMIADSNFFDNSIGFCRLCTRNKKRLNCDAKRRLKYIPGVQNATVDVNIPDWSLSDKNSELPTAKVYLTVQKDYDKTRIKRTAKNMIAGSAGIPEENINITFENNADESNVKSRYSITNDLIVNSYYNRAKMLYYKAQLGNKNYSQSINLLKELRQKSDYCYDSNIKALEDLQTVESAIKKHPNDYKLYIQLGDTKNIPENSMFCSAPQGFVSDYYGAIEAYTKALELNNKAYEVYEKRGDAWAECGYKKCDYCKLERTEKEDENVIKDYEKAIELTGGNDRLYEKLADRYKNKNPQKAIELYSKIQNYNKKEEQTPIPYLSEGGFKGSNYGYVPLKKAECYAQLKDYDSALNIIDEIIKQSNDTRIIQQADNLKFLYNWKAKHYITALKNSDNCNVWICKITGLIF